MQFSLNLVSQCLIDDRSALLPSRWQTITGANDDTSVSSDGSALLEIKDSH